MEIEEAISIIQQVTEQYRGTLQEHKQLQQAVQKIKEGVVVDE
jgi:hypothetical protein